MGQLIEDVQPCAIEFGLPWGSTVRGQRWGTGTDVVLLLHEPGSDLDAWGALPARLATVLGAMAIAVDLPGHGLSDNPWAPEHAEPLIDTLVRTFARPSPSDPALQAQPLAEEEARDWAADGPPATRRFVVAAGSIATVVRELGAVHKLTASVLLSPTALSATRSTADAIPHPPNAPRKGRTRATTTLYIAGAAADHDLQIARRLAASAAGWSVVTSIPESARGTKLLATEWRNRIEEEIIVFLRDARRPGSVPLEPRVLPRFPG